MVRKTVFALAAALLTAGAATGAQARDIIVYQAPPAPRVEVVPVMREREMWDPGHWAQRHHRWVWVPGRVMVVEYSERHWEPGHWVARPRGWIWVEGHWG